MTILASQLAQLENAQLVRRVPEEVSAYVFKHALTQESAYNVLLVKNRREIHRRVAEAVERIYPDRLNEYAALLATHYAEAGDDARTAIYAIRAGEGAAKISAYHEANVHFAAALEALSRLPDTDQNRRMRIETTIKQVNVAWGIDPAERNLERLFQVEALAKSFAEADPQSLASIHYWIARVYSYLNEHRLAAAYNEQVLAAAHASRDMALAGLAASLQGRTFFLQGYFGKAVTLLEQAIPYLERIENWYEWVLAKVSLAISLAAQGHYQEGRTQGEEAVQKALALNDQSSIASARGMTARVEFMAGDLERMIDETQIVEKEVEGINPLVHYMVLGFQAWAEGRLGKIETARAHMAGANAVAAQVGPRLIFADWFIAAHAEIELNAGQTQDALHLAKEAVEAAEAAGGIFSAGIAQRVWGQALAGVNLSEPDQAEAHLETSVRLLEEGEAVIEVARTRIAWGKVLLLSGDTSAAVAQFERAAAQFETAGLFRELTEARQVIDSLSI